MSILRPIALAMPIALALLLGSAAVAPAATLRSSVSVEGREIRLADIFDNAGVNGDKVVAQAPSPGRSISLEAAWLYRVARAYRVDWRPASRYDRVVVERASHIISVQEISSVVASALRDQANVTGLLEIELDNRALQINLPIDKPATVMVSAIDIDRRSDRFTALLMAPDERPGALRLQVTGKIHRLAEVPVLVQRMRAGEVIGGGDLDFVTMRVDQIDRTAFLDPEKIVGMSPRRVLMEGRPVRAGDIRPPILVSRGSIVTVMFTTGAMTLTARGKATEDGAEGDTILVQNTKSGKTIAAVVAGTGVVHVIPAHRLALQ